MPRKEIIYQGLNDLNVLIEDTSLNSPDYFRITKLPSELTAGINILKFKGNAELFAEGTPIFVEILDSNGDPIYYETDLDLESAEQTAIVSIYITEDIPPGPADVIICSSARKSINNIPLDSSKINLRWKKEITVDPSKRNTDEIIFTSMPKVSITSNTGSYTNLQYENSNRIITQSIFNLEYRYINDQAVLYTGSNHSGNTFISTALSAQIRIPYTGISNKLPVAPGAVNLESIFTSSISAFSGSGIAYLEDPIIFNITNRHFKYLLRSATVNATIVYEQSASLTPSITENSHNLATVVFTGLQPQIGTVSKIRSYYRSAGVGEYILSNETDVSDQADEFGFTPNIVTASFFINTIHRNDYLDFKFEFVNPAGFVSKQVVESLNYLFLGGNSYIGGDDNLLTGSLYVAGATGTGVHISGKGSAAMIRSIGYTGFYNATHNLGQSGFVIYSGSVQPLLSSSESYSGVGIELVANSESYFKYTTANGGLLDIRTDSFYLGNSSSYISSSAGFMEIGTENFTLDRDGHVTASAVLVEEIVGGEKQIMIDTSKAILDATNLGRTLYQDQSEYDISVITSLAFLPGNRYATSWYPIGTFIFQGLRNEFNYIISYQSKIKDNGTDSSVFAGVVLRASMSFQDSGSATGTSRYGFYGRTGSDGGPVQDNAIHQVFNISGLQTYTRTFSEKTVLSLSLIDTGSFTGSKYQGKLTQIDLDMRLEASASTGAEVAFTGTVSNITVTGTRGLASSFTTPGPSRPRTVTNL